MVPLCNIKVYRYCNASKFQHLNFEAKANISYTLYDEEFVNIIFQKFEISEHWISEFEISDCLTKILEIKILEYLNFNFPSFRYFHNFHHLCFPSIFTNILKLSSSSFSCTATQPDKNSGVQNHLQKNHL